MYHIMQPQVAPRLARAVDFMDLSAMRGRPEDLDAAYQSARDVLDEFYREAQGVARDVAGLRPSKPNPVHVYVDPEKRSPA